MFWSCSIMNVFLNLILDYSHVQTLVFFLENLSQKPFLSVVSQRLLICLVQKKVLPKRVPLRGVLLWRLHSEVLLWRYYSEVSLPLENLKRESDHSLENHF